MFGILVSYDACSEFANKIDLFISTKIPKVYWSFRAISLIYKVSITNYSP